MTTLFVSDLHLDPERPAITALFERFLAGEARGARALYILGDLFEAWVGDDDPSPAGARVASALQDLRTAGVATYFIHGNRDFLLGHAYAEHAGMQLLPDPAVILLDGEPVLIGHGDLYCTDDTAYQTFRSETRTSAWRERFLAQPLAARLAFAARAREASRQHQDTLQGADDGRFERITDVNPQAITETFRRFGVRRMIHGHTHRPAIHTHEVDGRTCERIVLGDWYTQGSVLRVRDGTAELASLAA
jgi:UDP-2,3-diacylglucosamine hydrolase